MAKLSDLEPYCVVDVNGKYEVRAPSGRTVMVCADGASAVHYAVLLNEAFDVGYKMGVRAGRSGE